MVRKGHHKACTTDHPAGTPCAGNFVEVSAARKAEPSRATPLHDLLPPCRTCGAPAGERCVRAMPGGAIRFLPGTAVHASRVLRRVPEGDVTP
jgi:hypothetical protein